MTKTYTMAQYRGALGALLARREEELAKWDAQVTKLAEAMVMLDGTTADDETGAYVQLRNLKEATNGYAKKREAVFVAYIDKLGAKLLKRLNSQDVKSMASVNGTFYKEKDHKPSCADWKVFYAWVKETDNFEFLEKRLTKKQVVEYEEEHKKLPPGLSMSSEYKVVVRKGKE